MEKCGNCGNAIGDLETAHVWKDFAVCTACHRKLAGDATASDIRRPTRRKTALFILPVFGLVVFGIYTYYHGRPTIGSLNHLADKLMPTIEHRDSGLYPDNVAGEKTTFIFNRQGVDVRKTDSLAHPIIGEIKWSERVSTGVPGQYTITFAYEFNLQLVYEGGQWKSIGGTQRCTEDSAYPELPGRQSRSGESSAIVPDYMQYEISASER